MIILLIILSVILIDHLLIENVKSIFNNLLEVIQIVII